MDYQLEHWINSPAGHTPGLDTLMRAAASWAEPLFIALVVGWFLFGWWKGQARDRQGAITAGIAAVLALLVNQVITHLWTRPRPFVTHPAAVHVLLAHSRDPSFPSDHAAPAFAIAAVLFALHRRLGLVALAVATLMSYARVYVGDHYPADVVAGALIGTAVALLLTGWLSAWTARLRQLVDGVIVRLHLPLPA